MVTPDPNYGGAFWAIGQFTVSQGNVATKITRFTIGPDTDSNGIPDACQDCNNNGVDDALDLTGGTSPDCNTNGFPDDCETAELMGDCNANGVPDSCEIAAGTADDCDSLTVSLTNAAATATAMVSGTTARSPAAPAQTATVTAYRTNVMCHSGMTVVRQDMELVVAIQTSKHVCVRQTVSVVTRNGMRPVWTRWRAWLAAHVASIAKTAT